ncbi:urotensin-2 [Prionailurus viverrinus]|uniref:urotensin-2 n=1 Tax=Prionailurus bengalensis TaxID=37029 RepID=UPI001CA9BF00|nr:urotensin-2 [Prionailurus bengalensis]XP_047728833.1 urotensin-2 [Prionailurus viverrinus]
MHKLVSCLLFIGCLQPLFSLPVPDSREEALKLSAPDGDARSTLDELERVYLLQMLEMLGAERGDSLRKAGLGTGTANPRGGMRQFQAFFGQDPNIFLSQLLARIRKQYKKRGSPSECFWKYCV